MQQADEQFCNIKADLHIKSFICTRNQLLQTVEKNTFLRNFDGPFVVTGHPQGKQDLLNLCHATSGHDWPYPVNVEKIVCVPEENPSDIAPQDLVELQNSLEKETEVAPMHSIAPNPDLAEVAYRIGNISTPYPPSPLSHPKHANLSTNRIRKVEKS